MDKKRIMSFILLISFLIAVIPSVSFAEDRTYSITQANIDLFVQEMECYRLMKNSITPSPEPIMEYT